MAREHLKDQRVRRSWEPHKMHPNLKRTDLSVLQKIPWDVKGMCGGHFSWCGIMRQKSLNPFLKRWGRRDPWKWESKISLFLFCFMYRTTLCFRIKGRPRTRVHYTMHLTGFGGQPVLASADIIRTTVAKDKHIFNFKQMPYKWTFGTHPDCKLWAVYTEHVRQ